MAQIKFAALPPEEAIAFFRQKGYKIGFDWRDVWQQEHQAAFTVAKAMQLDILRDIRAAVDGALADGTTLADFRKNLKPLLVQKGWWGRADMEDPLTGEVKNVQLGSTRRLKTIYDTNLRTAHSEGQWERIQASKQSFPYLQYDGNNSEHPRLQHSAWDGMVLPVNDPFWQSHMPIKDYGCKCRVIQMTGGMLERRGLTVSESPKVPTVTYTNKRTGQVQQIPAGVHPSFHYPPGGRRENLTRMLADKVEAARAADAAVLFKGAATTVMPSMQKDYFAWVSAIEAGQSKGLGGRRVIGAVTETSLGGLRGLGVELQSAALSIEQREVSHLLAEDRKAHKSLPHEIIRQLPEKLLAPSAVLYDSTPGSEAILYAWKLDDGQYARVAIRPNFKLKRENYTNAIRSGHIVNRANLFGKYLTILEGEL